MKEKYKELLAKDMEFDDFVKWATGYILLGIGEGRPLRDLVWMIVNQAAQNKNFGNKN